MACKLLVLAGLVVLARAGVLAPLAARLEDPDFDPSPQYTFAYEVQDALTGDSKNQFETRNGDIVQGRYSLIEPDGSRRTVDYTADPINGFNAIVQREPLVVATPARILAPLVATRPVLAGRTVATPVFGPVAREAVPNTKNAPVPPTNTLAEPVPEVRRTAERVASGRLTQEPTNRNAQPTARLTDKQTPTSRQQATSQDAENIPAVARIAAPIIPGAPIARLASPVPRLLTPSAKLTYPTNTIAYTAPFGFPAAYTTLF